MGGDSCRSHWQLVRILLAAKSDSCYCSFLLYAGSDKLQQHHAQLQ